jgi:hypothetical protein
MNYTERSKVKVKIKAMALLMVSLILLLSRSKNGKSMKSFGEKILNNDVLLLYLLAQVWVISLTQLLHLLLLLLHPIAVRLLRSSLALSMMRMRMDMTKS